MLFNAHESVLQTCFQAYIQDLHKQMAVASDRSKQEVQGVKRKVREMRRTILDSKGVLCLPTDFAFGNVKHQTGTKRLQKRLHPDSIVRAVYKGCHFQKCNRSSVETQRNRLPPDSASVSGHKT